MSHKSSEKFKDRDGRSRREDDSYHYRDREDRSGRNSDSKSDYDRSKHDHRDRDRRKFNRDRDSDDDFNRDRSRPRKRKSDDDAGEPSRGKFSRLFSVDDYLFAEPEEAYERLILEAERSFERSYLFGDERRLLAQYNNLQSQESCPVSKFFEAQADLEEVLQSTLPLSRPNPKEFILRNIVSDTVRTSLESVGRWNDNSDRNISGGFDFFHFDGLRTSKNIFQNTLSSHQSQYQFRAPEDSELKVEETSFESVAKKIASMLQEKSGNVPLQAKALDKLCYNCHEKGHIASECKYPLKACYICKKSGHVQRECPMKDDSTPSMEKVNNTKRPLGSLENNSSVSDCCLKEDSASSIIKKDDSKINCYNCHENGHISKNCIFPKGICYGCKKVGHKFKDCPSADNLTLVKQNDNISENLSNKEVSPSKDDSNLITKRFSSSNGDSKVVAMTAISKKTCFNCNDNGHLLADCPYPKGVCYKCKQVGHIAHDCPEKSDKMSKENFVTAKKKVNPSKDDPDLIAKRFSPLNNNSNHTATKVTREKSCFRCHEKGHLMADCPYPIGICYKCKQTGHVAPDCPSTDNIMFLEKNDNISKQDFIAVKKEVNPLKDSMADCRDPVGIRFKCQQAGHVGPDCPSTDNIMSPERNDNILKEDSLAVKKEVNPLKDSMADCRDPVGIRFKCQQAGHVGPDCPSTDNIISPERNDNILKEDSIAVKKEVNPLKGLMADCRDPVGICFKCQQPGHMDRDCPSTDNIMLLERNDNISKEDFIAEKKEVNPLKDLMADCLDPVVICCKCKLAGHMDHDCLSTDNLMLLEKNDDVSEGITERSNPLNSDSNVTATKVVDERISSNCREETHLIADCSYSKNICYKCNLVGHKIRDCPFTDDCLLLEKKDNISKDKFISAKKEVSPLKNDSDLIVEKISPLNSNSDITTKRATHQCFRCHEKGHWRENCPYPVGTCYICKGVGHMSCHCPLADNFKLCEKNDDFSEGITEISNSLNNNSKLTTLKNMDKICFNCNEKGHFLAGCPYPNNICYKCKQVGHKVLDCPFTPVKSDDISKDNIMSAEKEVNLLKDDSDLDAEKLSPSNNSDSTTVKTIREKLCYRCYEKGHIKANCPYPFGTCYKCKEVGHKSRLCPLTRKYTLLEKNNDNSEGTAKKFNPFNNDSEFITMENINKKCSNCREEGHYLEHCPYPNNICYICKQVGHEAINCPDCLFTRRTY